MNIRGRKDQKTLFGFTLSYRDSSVFERLNLASLGSLSNVFHQDELDHRNLLWVGWTRESGPDQGANVFIRRLHGA